MSSTDDHPGDAPSETTGKQYASRDMLRALGHPLRMQLLMRIGGRGTARAADLAEDLGIPANSISYHLRILAKGGVIIEAPEAARDRRDRVWKLAQLSFDTATTGQHLQDGTVAGPDYLAASAAATMATFDWMREGFTAESALEAEQLDRGQDGEPGSAEGAGAPEDSEVLYRHALQSTMLHVTPTQAKELVEIVKDAITRWVRLNRDEDGAVLPDDPDSEEPAVDFRVLFAMVRDRPQPPDGQDS